MRYNETTGARNKMQSNTTGMVGRYSVGRGAWGSSGWEKPVTTMWHVVPRGHDPLSVGSDGKLGGSGQVTG